MMNTIKKQPNQTCFDTQCALDVPKYQTLKTNYRHDKYLSSNDSDIPMCQLIYINLDGKKLIDKTTVNRMNKSST